MRQTSFASLLAGFLALPPPSAEAGDELEQSRVSVLEHLEELRKRLRNAGLVLVASGLGPLTGPDTSAPPSKSHQRRVRDPLASPQRGEAAAPKARG